MARTAQVSGSIERSKDGCTITVPSSGDHHGRNGYAKIVGMQIRLRRDGTVYLDSINSRGGLTVGGLHHVPAKDFVLLLEQLKAEMRRFETGPSSDPALEPLVRICQERGLACEDLDEAVHDAAGQQATRELNQAENAEQHEGILCSHDHAASKANNDGLSGQLQFLVQAVGEAAMRAILHEIASNRLPSASPRMPIDLKQ